MVNVSVAVIFGHTVFEGTAVTEKVYVASFEDALCYEYRTNVNGIILLDKNIDQLK